MGVQVFFTDSQLNKPSIKVYYILNAGMIIHRQTILLCIPELLLIIKTKVEYICVSEGLFLHVSITRHVLQNGNLTLTYDSGSEGQDVPKSTSSREKIRLPLVISGLNISILR